MFPLTKHQRELLMEQAIDQAKVAAYVGERPFGCVIVKPQWEAPRPFGAIRYTVLAVASGSETYDNPICHSEVRAIERACKGVGGLLRTCLLISTHEPCALCCGAIRHAKLDYVMWGSTRAQVPELFRQQKISAIDLLNDTSTPPQIHIGTLRRECVALFDSELKP